MSIFCNLLAKWKTPTKESVACTKESISPARFQSNWGSWSEKEQNWKFLNFKERILAQTWDNWDEKKAQNWKVLQVFLNHGSSEGYTLEVITVSLPHSNSALSFSLLKKESVRGYGSCSKWQLVFRCQPTRGRIHWWRRIPSGKSLWDPQFSELLLLSVIWCG